MDDVTKNQIALLRELKNSTTWKLLKVDLERRIKETEDIILNSFDFKYNDRKFSFNDLKKVERQCLWILLELPDDLILQLDNIFESINKQIED